MEIMLLLMWFKMYLSCLLYYTAGSYSFDNHEKGKCAKGKWVIRDYMQCTLVDCPSVHKFRVHNLRTDDT